MEENHPVAYPLESSVNSTPPNSENDPQSQTVVRWFSLFERFAKMLIFLGGLWLGAGIIDSRQMQYWVGFALTFYAVLMAARLVTMAFKTVLNALSGLGNRYFSLSKYNRYWERVTRLFPFGEKCFEGAVYIFAATHCIQMMNLFNKEQDFFGSKPGDWDIGTKIVVSIGIFFVTRVMIELMHVLIHEAFGLSDEKKPADQKGQTLVPLFAIGGSIWFVFWFGNHHSQYLGNSNRTNPRRGRYFGVGGRFGCPNVSDRCRLRLFHPLRKSIFWLATLSKLPRLKGAWKRSVFAKLKSATSKGRFTLFPMAKLKP